MGWFLWGILFGWGMCATWYYSQVGDAHEKVASGAAIIFCALGIIAVIVSINFGIASGAIPTDHASITPTSLGR